MAGTRIVARAEEQIPIIQSMRGPAKLRTFVGEPTSTFPGGSFDRYACSEFRV
jgi:hypothetical protein